MQARPIPELKQLIEDAKVEEQLLQEEIELYQSTARFKLQRMHKVVANRSQAEYELRNHPDSMWEATNNSYEFTRDSEKGSNQ